MQLLGRNVSYSDYTWQILETGCYLNEMCKQCGSYSSKHIGTNPGAGLVIVHLSTFLAVVVAILADPWGFFVVEVVYHHDEM